MNSSRVALIAMLVGVEIFIAGFAIWCVGGAGHLSAAGFGPHQVDYTAQTVASFDAGDAPHVVVSDPQSRVKVSVSTDGRVHVKDLTSVHGYMLSGPHGYSSIPKLQATRTADGVSIERAEYDDHFMGLTIGDSDQVIEVDVPAGTHLEIVKSSGADVSGLTGGVKVSSQDGHITLAALQGTVDVHSADGYIEASNLHGDTITLASADGHVKASGVRCDTLTLQSNDGNVSAQDVAAQTFTARSNDGRIEAANLSITGSQPAATLHSDDGSVHVAGRFAANGTYEVSSGDGRVELTLPRGSDLTVNASTADGGIYVDGNSGSSDGDSHQQTIKLGSGSGAMRVSSGDGSIHLTTNGAL
jgi:hypothetical protein